jgi:hypothetical protein
LVKTNPNPTAPLKTKEVLKDPSSSSVKDPTARLSLLRINRSIQQPVGNEHDNRNSTGEGIPVEIKEGIKMKSRDVFTFRN